jgi:hypothetical protein
MKMPLLRSTAGSISQPRQKDTIIYMSTHTHAHTLTVDGGMLTDTHSLTDHHSGLRLDDITLPFPKMGLGPRHPGIPSGVSAALEGISAYFKHLTFAMAVGDLGREHAKLTCCSCKVAR